MIRSTVLLALGLALALPPPAALAQPAPAASPAAAREVVAAARSLLAERYVVPETAARLDDALGAAAARGEFDGLSGAALAERIDAVMHAVTPDGHLYTRYDPRQAADLAAAPAAGDDVGLPSDWARQVARENGGVRRLEILPGNIRYLDYRQFMWDDSAAEAALAQAMAFLAGGDAMIIDLRNNGGGSPAAVAAMTGYFLAAGTPLARFEMRGQPGETNAAHAAPFSLAGKPLYVLTSPRSFSAAEEFATHVSAFGFGTLVGTATGGGGFRNEFFALPGGFVMSVSIGRPVHAVTGGDWERVGVAPKIAVAEDKALVRAQAEAMTALAQGLPAAERPAAERLVAYYRALADGVTADLPLAAYAGTYGDRTVEAADGVLLMRRGNRPQTRLIPLGDNLFATEAAPAQRVGFVIENGSAVALELDGGNGPPNRIAKQAG